MQQPTPAQDQSFALLLVVPVYNHAATLARVLADLSALSLPVLVVDDGSRDAIDEVLSAFPHVQKLKHEQNLGKGAALSTALCYGARCGYSHILSFDADGQHRAQDVPILIGKAQASRAAIVIGSRDFASEQSGDVPRSSKFGRSFSNFWIRLETGTRLSDTQSGLRVYPCDPALLQGIKGRRYSFEVEILVQARWQGREILSVPVSVYYPPRGQRVSHFLPWADNFRLTMTHTRLCCLRILQGLGLTSPSQALRSKEMRGAGFAAWMIQHGGAGLAYSLLIFPVLSSFILRGQERRAMVGFHRRLAEHEARPSSAAYCSMQALRNFWYFAASIVDRLRSEGEALIDVESARHLIFPPPGSIMVGAHYGDWFLIARRAADLNLGVLGLVMDPKLTPAFYASIEGRFGGQLRLLSPEDDLLGFALATKEILEGGGRICFMIDRLPQHSRGAASLLPIEFLGGRSQWLKAPFAIATRLRAPVHFVCALKRGWSKSSGYEIFATEIWNGQESLDEQQLANRTAAALETQVRGAPQHWFNFSSIWREEGL